MKGQIPKDDSLIEFLWVIVLWIAEKIDDLNISNNKRRMG